MPGLNQDQLDDLLKRPGAWEQSLCVDRLIDFVHFAWSSLEPAIPFISGPAVEIVAEHLQAVTEGQIRHIVINVPPGCTKACDVDTPVMTTWGWKRHGDLCPGDFVFGPDGCPIRVTGRTPWMLARCYDIKFDDGSSVVASDGHEWEVDRDEGRTPRRRDRMLITTPEIKDGSRPDSIRVAAPVELPPRDLLVDPYLLGAWLGDGATDSGCIYAADQDVHVLLPYGEIAHSQPPGDTRTQVFHRLRIPGLQVRLRVMGLLGNKHVPDSYLEASVDQRWDLLRGLMDTDGTCTKEGQCRFTTKLGHLADQVHRLVCSLGMKARISSRHTMLNGKRYGPHYTVSFRPHAEQPVFRLSRKQNRVGTRPNTRTRNRYVKSVAPIGDRIVNCIEVEGGIYLVGHALIPTHNSMLTNVFWPAWEWGPKQFPHHRFISASYDKGLATRDLVRCRDLIKSEWYSRWWPTTFKLDQDQKTYYENTDTGWRFAASVGGALTGYRGDRIIIDDPHDVRKAESDIEREDAIRWLTETVPTRYNKQNESSQVIIMQRLHERDASGLVIGELLEQGWEHLCLPMEFEAKHCSYTRVKNNTSPIRGRKVKPLDDPIPIFEECVDGDTFYRQDRRTEESQLLDPVRFPREAVEDLKATFRAGGGTYAEAAQLQQRPAPREGGMFKKEHAQYLEPGDTPTGRSVRGWDLAASETVSAKYTAGVKMCLANDGRIIILDVERFKGSPFKVKEGIKDAARCDGHATMISIPQDPGQAGKAQVSEFAKVLHGFTVRFSPESGDKVVRASPFQTQWEAGNVWLVRAPWNDPFVAELCMFPGGRFSDQVDGASRAYHELLKGAGPQLALLPPTVFTG